MSGIEGVEHVERVGLGDLENRTVGSAVFLGAIGGFVAMGTIGLFVGAIVLSVGYKLVVAWLEHRSPMQLL